MEYRQMMTFQCGVGGVRVISHVEKTADWIAGEGAWENCPETVGSCEDQGSGIPVLRKAGRVWAKGAMSLP